MKKVILVVVSCIACVAGYYLISTLSRDGNATINGSGQADISSKQPLPPGVTEEQYESAAQWIQQNFPLQSLSHEAVLLVVAERAAKQEQSIVAIACYRQIATSVPKFGLVARLEEAKLLVERNLADQAEASLSEYLNAAKIATELQPQQLLDAFKWLSYILSVEIRQEERKALLIEQHQIGLADPLDSKQLFFPNLLILNSPAGRKRIESFQLQDPLNVRLRLASARYRTLEGSYDEAVNQLEQLQKEFPGDLHVCAALAEAYFENANGEKLNQLISHLPARSADEPWLLTRLRGEHALEVKNWQTALDCFEQVLLNDPTNAPAQMGCAKAWAGQGNEEKRQESLQRSAIIAEIRVNLSSVQVNAQAACIDLAQKCRKLGFITAAEVFEKHATIVTE